MRTLGTPGVYTGFSASADTLRDRIEAKAGRYGRMPHPYLLVINNYDMCLDLDDVHQALLGNRNGVLETDGARASRLDNTADAVWVRQGQPFNRQLSAVLVAKQVLPSSPSGEFAVVYHNPWAWDPLPEGLLGISAFLPRDGRAAEGSGQPAAEILGLPSGWPHDADQRPR